LTNFPLKRSKKNVKYDKKAAAIRHSERKLERCVILRTAAKTIKIIPRAKKRVIFWLFIISMVFNYGQLVAEQEHANAIAVLISGLVLTPMQLKNPSQIHPFPD
jgi:hypothetical protein